MLSPLAPPETDGAAAAAVPSPSAGTDSRARTSAGPASAPVPPRPARSGGLHVEAEAGCGDEHEHEEDAAGGVDRGHEVGHLLRHRPVVDDDLLEELARGLQRVELLDQVAQVALLRTAGPLGGDEEDEVDQQAGEQAGAGGP